MKRSFKVFTSCNLAYLPQAMILLDSVRRRHGDCNFSIVLVEEKRRFPKSIQNCLDRFDQVIYPEDLWGDERFTRLFPYEVVEACTAVKGAALSKLLEDGLPVIYLDPDIVIFNRLDSVLSCFTQSSILLTPHQLLPLDPDQWGEVHDERVSLLTGVYNFGFLAVVPSEEGINFSKWWEYRTTNHAFDDRESGLFTDQKWGNLVPILFPGTRILRHKGMNVASWNLHERKIQVSADGEYLIENDPLIFFHFTKGFGGLQPVLQKSTDNIYVASIWRWYLERLTEERARITSSEWSYLRYKDQDRAVIEKPSRQSFRRLGPRTQFQKNPFVR